MAVVLAYQNLSGAAVSIVDTYPKDAKLTVNNVTAGGVNNGTNIVWAPALTGSGAFTGPILNNLRSEARFLAGDVGSSAKELLGQAKTGAK